MLRTLRIRRCRLKSSLAGTTKSVPNKLSYQDKQMENRNPFDAKFEKAANNAVSSSQGVFTGGSLLRKSDSRTGAKLNTGREVKRKVIDLPI